LRWPRKKGGKGRKRRERMMCWSFLNGDTRTWNCGVGIRDGGKEMFGEREKGRRRKEKKN